MSVLSKVVWLRFPLSKCSKKCALYARCILATIAIKILPLLHWTLRKLPGRNGYISSYWGCEVAGTRPLGHRQWLESRFYFAKWIW